MYYALFKFLGWQRHWVDKRMLCILLGKAKVVVKTCAFDFDRLIAIADIILEDLATASAGSATIISELRDTRSEAIYKSISLNKVVTNEEKRTQVTSSFHGKKYPKLKSRWSTYKLEGRDFLKNLPW